ncbi:unnamed protein product, partial [Mesorhabditis spiculigera]
MPSAGPLAISSYACTSEYPLQDIILRIDAPYANLYSDNDPNKPLSPSSIIKSVKTLFEKPAPLKRVRFSDDNGADLCTVWSYEKQEPRRHTMDMNYRYYQPNNQGRIVWQIQRGPRNEPAEAKISLEKLEIQDGTSPKICGIIKIANLGFNKDVQLRYTTNDWFSSLDHPAKYSASPSADYDLFEFTMDLPSRNSHPRLDFCLFCDMEGARHWDSRDSLNYSLTWSRAK